ncbi:outer membrane beta-barrel protein [Chondrinema litorale]|uniref:outer membrane beta-barrel protein n=1 Tax=Chondrinema litorale TaxID=2994555 RepID=UPI002542F541|nr:outer membrane beta-barrel protein [Chondrinema litorale]UZR95113.1 hypothetical protein OQ292_04690 [Chondrinema litorale]
MTYKKLFLTVIVLFLFSISTNLFAQFSAAIGPGFASYSGDVSGEKFNDIRPALNMELWYQFNRNLYLKTGASIYQIAATDVFEDRNRDFKATNFELYTSLMLGGAPEWKLMPFGYAGVGLSTNDPQYAMNTDQGKVFLDAKELNTESRDIPGAELIVPMGIGLRYRLNDRIAIVADGGLRFTTSDLLDGLSTRTIEVASLSQEAVNYFETIRPNGINGAETIGNGNPEKNDVYGIFSVKILFNLNGNGRKSNSMPCPPFYSY